MNNPHETVLGFFRAHDIDNSIYPYIEKSWKQAINEKIKCWNKIKKQIVTTLMDIENLLEKQFTELHEENIYIEKICKKYKDRGMMKWRALEIFKEELKTICVEKICKKEDKEHFNKILTSIKNPERDMNIQKAFSVNMSDVLDHLGIKHNGSRCVTPFTEGSSNESTMSFKGQVFYCFKTAQKGNQVQFIQKIHNKTFTQAVEFINSIHK
jgi:hypothetical protein